MFLEFMATAMTAPEFSLIGYKPTYTISMRQFTL